MAGSIKSLPTEPVYADDLWREIEKLHDKGSEENANEAACKLFNMRRSYFAGAEEYIILWRLINAICTSLKIGITPYMSTVIMFDQVKPDLPEPVALLRGRIAMRGGNAVNMEQSEFFEICDRLLGDDFEPLPSLTSAMIEAESKVKKVS